MLCLGHAKHVFVILGVLLSMALSDLPNILYAPQGVPLGPVVLNYSTYDVDNPPFTHWINIGAFIPYGKLFDPTDLLAYYAYYSILGWKYWEYVVNSVRSTPGIALNNTRYGINITIINIGLLDNDVTIVSQNATRGDYGHFDLFFGPYTTTRTILCAVQTEMRQKLLIATWPALKSAFECPLTANYASTVPCTSPGARRFPHMWGLIPLGGTYWDNLLNLLKLKGSKTIALWAVNDPFPIEVVTGTETTAYGLGYDVLTPSMYNATGNPYIILGEDPKAIFQPTDRQLDEMVSQLRGLNPDVIISGIRSPSTCVSFIKAVQRANYAPQAITLMLCADATAASLRVESKYFLDYTFWAKEVKGLGFGEHRDWVHPVLPAAAYFAQNFTNYFGVEATGFCALPYATGYVVEAALYYAQSLNIEKMNAALPLVLEESFSGIIGFNGFGYNDKNTLPILQINSSGFTEVVAPLGSAQNDMVYPFVSWSSRLFVSYYLESGVEQAIFVLSIICIIFSTVCFVLLRLHWNDKAIVASSPVFLSIMLFGSILTFATVPTWMLYTDSASCHLRLWFLCLGFTLLFGTLVAKTYRVRELFLVHKMRPKKFSDSKLLIIVGSLVAVDLLILILWSSVTQPYVAKTVVSGTGRLDGKLWEDLNFNECVWTSVSMDAMTGFYIIEGIYKVTLILAGIYLSVSLWQYGNSMWSESKQMLFAIYNIITFALIGLALQLSLGNEVSSSTRSVLFVTRSVCILLSGVVTVGAILFPRLNDPKGEGRKDNFASSATNRTAAETLALSDLEFRYDALEKKYQVLKQRFREACPDAELSGDDKLKASAD